MERMRPLANQQREAETTSEQLTELLEQAMQHPGVSELMDVYARCKPVETAARPYLNALGAKAIIATSNGSGPVIRHIP
jgi:hypothetical protein